MVLAIANFDIDYQQVAAHRVVDWFGVELVIIAAVFAASTELKLNLSFGHCTPFICLASIANAAYVGQ